MTTFRITGGVLTGTAVSDAYPDNTLPSIPGPVDPGYGISADRPSHPIVIPPDAVAPGVPTHPIYLPVYPAHPIVIPPGSLAPGVPTHPIYLPVYPAHPIVIPPDAAGPGVPTHPIVLPPLGTWGPNDPRPTPPIVIPPEAIIPGADGKAHVVVYYQGQRVTFTVEVPPPTVPTTPAPKVATKA